MHGSGSFIEIVGLADAVEHLVGLPVFPAKAVDPVLVPESLIAGGGILVDLHIEVVELTSHHFRVYDDVADIASAASHCLVIPNLQVVESNVGIELYGEPLFPVDQFVHLVDPDLKAVRIRPGLGNDILDGPVVRVDRDYAFHPVEIGAFARPERDDEHGVVSGVCRVFQFEEIFAETAAADGIDVILHHDRNEGLVKRK